MFIGRGHCRRLWIFRLRFSKYSSHKCTKEGCCSHFSIGDSNPRLGPERTSSTQHFSYARRRGIFVSDSSIFKRAGIESANSANSTSKKGALNSRPFAMEARSVFTPAPGNVCGNKNEMHWITAKGIAGKRIGLHARQPKPLITI